MAMLPVSLPMEEASTLMPNFPHKLFSLKSMPMIFLLFVNSTGRQVNVYWVDFDGKLTFYYLLEPGTVVRVNTFPCHVWIFRDARTGEIMQVDKEDFYLAKFNGRNNNNDNNNSRNVNRTRVEIHCPMRTLSDICLWNCAGFLKDSLKQKHPSRINDQIKNSAQEVKHLELPNVISNDLIFYTKVRLRFDFFNQRNAAST